ncbi:MAG: hypothetical protein KY449_11340 [Proteobacteria bacterium]|nr:hypothetical protein [Pseudomonadota bacterium]
MGDPARELTHDLVLARLLEGSEFKFVDGALRRLVDGFRTAEIAVQDSPEHGETDQGQEQDRSYDGATPGAHVADPCVRSKLDLRSELLGSVDQALSVKAVG